jgi:hypothetical protein
LTSWLELLLLAVMVGGLSSCDDQAESKSVEPVKKWYGGFAATEDQSLRTEAPASGSIANARAWAKLWKAWRGEEELPKVDFDKQLVLVGTGGGAINRLRPHFDLDGKGDLKGRFMQTAMLGPGFCYLIVVVDRKGIKTYQGKAIAKE